MKNHFATLLFAIFSSLSAIFFVLPITLFSISARTTEAQRDLQGSENHGEIHGEISGENHSDNQRDNRSETVFHCLAPSLAVSSASDPASKKAKTESLELTIQRESSGLYSGTLLAVGPEHGFPRRRNREQVNLEPGQILWTYSSQEVLQGSNGELWAIQKLPEDVRGQMTGVVSFINAKDLSWVIGIQVMAGETPIFSYLLLKGTIEGMDEVLPCQ
ncbi:MAG: hypothetical protein C5B49_08785 [Bdellovibrio sp.]|nr:MAG: hypothetical protein C5B49_08785 [Bdellovibrio sp.]